MKITELIKELEKVLKINGDIRVTVSQRFAEPQRVEAVKVVRNEVDITSN